MERDPFLVVGWLLFLSVSIGAAGGTTTRYYTWEIANELKSPDCFRKLVTTVNGVSPGPTINAEEGDLIVVSVTNRLESENTAIHWHGIRQIGTPWFDGMEGVTQCPILPGETFVYQFTVDRPGTYIYHAHHGMQRSSGLYGSIVVSRPPGVVDPFSYDSDTTIMLNDWWHKGHLEQSAGLSSLPFVWINEPQSLLINGRGWYDCSLAGSADVCNQSSSECSPFILTVTPGRTYRLRISSMTSLSALNFEVEGHEMTVVEADGHYVDPFVVKNLNIYSGETYSVLLTADRNSSRNYWIATNVVSRQPKTPTGIAILHYSPADPKQRPAAGPPTGPLWNDTNHRFNQSRLIRARSGHVHPPPESSQRRIVFLNTQNRIDGRTRWAVNNISFTLPRIPYLVAFKMGLLNAFSQSPPPETYDRSHDIYNTAANPNAMYSDGVYRLGLNSTVDVVLQNANTMVVNNSETHPWHLHGHDFWVLGYGSGKFDPIKDPSKFNLENPIMKNTVPVHPYGWTAIRFVADNPGAWAFHCHIESHMYLGMGVVFEEGVETVGDLPQAFVGCGGYKGLAASSLAGTQLGSLAAPIFVSCFSVLLVFFAHFS